MSRVRTTSHSKIRECYQRRRKSAAVTPECSRSQQGVAQGRSGRSRTAAGSLCSSPDASGGTPGGEPAEARRLAAGLGLPSGKRTGLVPTVPDDGPHGRSLRRSLSAQVRRHRRRRRSDLDSTLSVAGARRHDEDRQGPRRPSPAAAERRPETPPAATHQKPGPRALRRFGLCESRRNLPTKRLAPETSRAGSTSGRHR